jgi:small conductance mechanosensitive channel
MQPRPKTLGTVLLMALLASSVSMSASAEDGAENELQPVTIGDPVIPTDQLELLLKPLTKDQLLVEADAWRSLVQAKAEEIVQAEIAIKRQNQEIAAAARIEKQATQAKENLAEVTEQVENARQTGDTKAAAAAEQAAAAARKRMDEVKASVEEAATAAERTAEAEAALSDETKQALDATEAAAKRATQALDNVDRAVDGAEDASNNDIRAAADNARAATTRAAEATAAVESEAEQAVKAVDADTSGTVLQDTAEAMSGVKEAKNDEKVALLEQIAELREERTQLLDQLKAVLAALEVKTPESDSATLAKIQDYKLYATAVSGVTIDVKDTTSAWLAIKGWLTSEEGGIRWAINLASFVAILIAAWIIAGIFSALIHRAMKRVPGTSRLLESFLVKSARWVVLAVGLIMALAALEISIGPLLAVVGAAGFVIAFALQDSLSNFASGLMILFFRPFDVGDVVDAGGVSGTVDSMNLVSTTIKTFDNKRMVVPNNKVWGDVITNASGVTERRVDMEFGIGYGDDIDQAQAILEGIIKSHPQVLQDPEPTIRMSALADSSVNFIVRPWAKTADYWQVFWDVTREVKKRFDAEGIGIPFPQRDVHLYLEGGRPDVLEHFRGSRPDAKSETRHEPQQTQDGGLDT